MAKLHRLLALVAVFTGIAETVYGTPLADRGPGHHGPAKKCKKPVKRRAWHTLNNKDKKAYIDAQLCVMRTPAKVALPGAVTQFDEMVSIHQLHALTIHSTGVFLPWHRWYLDLHERMLKDCGFKGALPYWDEYRDAKLPLVKDSSIFDPITGFGSQGSVAPDYCLTDGPFHNYTSRIGPWWHITDGCIGRQLIGNSLRENTFPPPAGSNNVTAATDACMLLTTWAEASTCIYLIPHVGGHIAIGSTRGDAHTSPNDPVFYLHHAYIDKLWWDWQEKNRAQRLYAVGGINKQDPAVGFIEMPGDMAFEAANIFQSSPNAAQLAFIPQGDDGDNGDLVTLNHTFTSWGHIPDAKVRDVMDSRGGYLCYEYV